MPTLCRLPRLRTQPTTSMIQAISRTGVRLLLTLLILCFATGCTSDRERRIPGEPTRVVVWDFGGVPGHQEWIKGAVERFNAGRDDIENWNFYVIYNLFRLVGIVQGVYKRGLDGIASSDIDMDTYYEQMMQRARRACQLVEEMG